MVEPIELQNMLGRTPLVEKTVAAQRDDIQQQANLAAQFTVQREHKNEKVQLKREGVRTETKRDEASKKQSQESGGSGTQESSAPTVELVRESTDEPEHRLDVTI
jgi:hypothetical protein